MNTGTFSGYLGRDAELRQAGGNDVLNFSVGVTVGWGDKKKTLWVGCALWGERGQKLAQYLVKGTPVSVTGDVDIRMYDSQGEKKAELTLNVQRLTMMGGKGGATGKSNVKAEPAAQDEFSDEIPF